MAFATRSSSAALVKAIVVLSLILALLAMAAGASSAEDGPAVAKSGGRFSETPVGRKLLNSTTDFCGPGSAPNFNCKTFFGPLAYNATCCTDPRGIKACFDVGGYDFFKCGSCTTMCKIGETCCLGVCADLTTNGHHCGRCGYKCHGGCTLGCCNY